jgi:TfoX/Sxy family transcriptional regulator of competence genes
VSYDQELARRIKIQLGALAGLEEKKMFGGVGFLLKGNMACGVNKDDLVVRLDPRRSEDALSRPHVKPFSMSGRTMAGWIMVSPQGCKKDEDLKKWIREGIDYAGSLPPK